MELYTSRLLNRPYLQNHLPFGLLTVCIFTLPPPPYLFLNIAVKEIFHSKVQISLKLAKQ